MSFKSITVTLDAYERLKKCKLPGDSFSDVLLRELPEPRDTFGAVLESLEQDPPPPANPLVTNHTIVAGAGANGVITPAGSVLVSDGAAQTFTFTPATGYTIGVAEGEAVAKEITGQGGKAVAVQANMAKTGDIERLFAESKKAFGRLDILVANHGIYDVVWHSENVTLTFDRLHSDRRSGELTAELTVRRAVTLPANTSAFT